MSMDKYLLVFMGFIVGILLLSANSDSGTLTSYGNVTFFNSADTIPVVLSASNSNSNINWSSFIQFASSNLNWVDIRAFGSSHGGDHSGINWQSFGT